jgi:DNA-directed RNA polymerase I subunit RPA1
LQWEGFTLGVHDILVQAEADKKRTKIIEESRKIGRSVTCQVLNIDESTSDEELTQKLEEAYNTDPKFRSALDRKYKSAMDVYTNDINKTCLPAGLVCKFPINNLQLMVLSGAKGSTVNTMQISCLLGQIELEGKRPPVMINGKSLPSFPVFECSPKAGGFIDGRFMTGIEPQGFLFHCMAGREGLIDTAVKTSRSGYLQRCLIKHLEGLTVSYDGTVRDSDKSVVQFNYGEDGMDILKSQFLNAKQMQFLVDNRSAVVNEKIVDALRNSSEDDLEINKIKKKIRSHEKKYGNWKIRNHSIKKKPPPIISTHPSHLYLGALSERTEKILNDFLKSNEGGNDNEVKEMYYVKNMQSLAEPGEPVGLLAAQSIGEPSTQMTLNTFHFAGRGDMNVTLGIPRLREILMMASVNIKTPSMEIPFLNQTSENLEKIADKFRIRLNQCTMNDVLKDVNVKSFVKYKPQRVRCYELTFEFLPQWVYKKQFMVKPKKIIKHTHEVFLPRLFKYIDRISKDDKGEYIEKDKKETKASKKADDDEDDQEKGDVDQVVKDLKDRDNNSSDEENEAMVNLK